MTTAWEGERLIGACVVGFLRQYWHVYLPVAIILSLHDRLKKISTPAAAASEEGAPNDSPERIYCFEYPSPQTKLVKAIWATKPLHRISALLVAVAVFVGFAYRAAPTTRAVALLRLCATNVFEVSWMAAAFVVLLDFWSNVMDLGAEIVYKLFYRIDDTNRCIFDGLQYVTMACLCVAPPIWIWTKGFPWSDGSKDLVAQARDLGWCVLLVFGACSSALIPFIQLDSGGDSRADQVEMILVISVTTVVLISWLAEFGILELLVDGILPFNPDVDIRSLGRAAAGTGWPANELNPWQYTLIICQIGKRLGKLVRLPTALLCGVIPITAETGSEIVDVIDQILTGP